MKKFGIILILVAILLLCTIFFQSKSTASVLHLPGKDISLIVVDTGPLRTRGLSGMKELPENSGMLFVFEYPDRYSFWMKDMKFPIDIVWLDADYKIMHIESDVSPATYPKTFEPPQNSLFVLETNAHFAEKNNLRLGEILQINLHK